MAETAAPAARRTVVLGASVHGVHAAEVLRAGGGTPVGYVDDAVPAGTVLHGLPVLGTLADLGAVLGDGRADDVLVGMGDNAARCRLVAQPRQEVPGVRFATAVHPSAVIGARTTIGDGTVVMAGVVVNNDCRIGEQVILYTSCSVDHDNVVGDYASLAPNAATGGNVTLGERVAVGLGASVIHRLFLGDGVVVGAGSVVLEHVPPNQLVVGNPARVVRQRADDEPYLAWPDPPDWA